MFFHSNRRGKAAKKIFNILMINLVNKKLNVKEGWWYIKAKE